MRILLSAYTCYPYSGSESGIGWNFAKKLAKQGHQIVIFTKNPDKDKSFTQETTKLNLQNNLSVRYYDLPRWCNLFYKSATASEHLYYFCWQIGLYLYVKKFLRKNDVDLIHHITLGVFRTPSFLYGLGKSFIFGTVGAEKNVRKF